MLEFLEEISFYENENEMSIEEIADCVGPVIIKTDLYAEW